MLIYFKNSCIQFDFNLKNLQWLCFDIALVVAVVCCFPSPVLALSELIFVSPEILRPELATLESQNNFSEFALPVELELQAILTELSYVPVSPPEVDQDGVFDYIPFMRGADLAINGRVDLVERWLQGENQSFDTTDDTQSPRLEVLTSPLSKAVQTFSDLDSMLTVWELANEHSKKAIASPSSRDLGVNGRVDLVERWLQAENQPFDTTKDNPLSLTPYSHTLPSLGSDYVFGDFIFFSEKIEDQLHPRVQNINISTPVVTPSPLPKLNSRQMPSVQLAPGSNTLVPRSNDLPFSNQTNLEELVTLAEDNAVAQGQPRYVPQIPLENPTPPQPETQEAPASPLPPNVPREVGQKILDIIIENLLDSGASKYPFIINTSDLLTINPSNFTPSKFNSYLNFFLDLDDFESINPVAEEAFSDPVLKNLSASVYPDDQQFYWILEGNRVVIETNGAHFNTGYQGIVSNRAIQQRATSNFSLFGQQAVWALPQTLGSITGVERTDNLQILSGVAQIVLPNNITLDPDLQINFTLNNFDGQGSDFTKIVRVDDVNKGNTSDLEGGGAFFTNLDADNAPRFLQAFPTVNIQGLLNSDVQFRRGETIPLENFQAMGITLGEFFSGQGFRFNNTLTSAPGIKTLQLNASDNNDLVKLLSSPFLTDRERDYHYLNSLMWNSGGQQPATVETIELGQSSEDWYRLTLSWSNNRTLLEYHPEKVELSYTNIFANPGLSLTYRDLGHIDDRQTLNVSLGLAFGGLFYLLNPNHLNNHLDEAHQHYQEARSMAPLKTQATSQERRAMNFRLNRTLQNASSNSSLSQVSGSYTFHGDVTPHNSLLMQVKSGIYGRAVSFFNQTVTDWSEAPIIMSSVRPSDFGPLIFAGINIPIELTSIDYNPVFTLGFVTVQDEGGQLLLEDSIRLDRSVLTTVPIIGGKAADIDFGRITFRQTIDRLITTSNYQGYLYLPALEFDLAGTMGDISYSVALGSWFNLYPQSAPGITENFAPPNSSISKEKSLGLYFKTFVKGDFTHIFYDAQNQWHTILTHTPSLSLNAGANPNRLNISSLGLSYTLQLLRREYNGSVTFSTSYSPQGLNAEFAPNSLGKLGLFTALNFYHQSGLRFSGSLSLGGTSFYGMEVTYDIFQSPTWGVLGLGPYYANYVVATRGFDSQVADSNYGLVINYTLPNSGLGIRAKLGTSESGFRGQLNINGQIKF